MSESPIDIARRVWPGEWSHDEYDTNIIALVLEPINHGINPLASRVEARRYENNTRWIVRLGLLSFWSLLASGNTLEDVLIDAKELVLSAVRRIANNVGLSTFARMNDRDAKVLDEVLAERQRAFLIQGPQPHPWTLVGGGGGIVVRGAQLEQSARRSLSLGQSWAGIVGEEAGESLRETDPKRVRPELIQLGAMVFAALSECPDFEVPDGE